SGGDRCGASDGVIETRNVSPFTTRAAVGKISTHTSYTVPDFTGSTDCFVNGWYGCTISPSCVTVLEGSSARNDSTCQPAESCVEFDPPPLTSSTRTVRNASFAVVETNSRAAMGPAMSRFDVTGRS